MKVSLHAAQASLKAPRGTRWAQSHHLHDTGLELTGVTRRRPHQQASCRHLLCLPSQLLRCSRAETPEGSQPAFAWSDLTRALNPYPSGYWTAFASSPSSTRRPIGNLLAEGLPREEDDGLTTFHGCTTDGLGSSSPPVAPTATAGEGRHPCTWPRTFWFKPLSAFGLLVLTTFISSSPEFKFRRFQGGSRAARRVKFPPANRSWRGAGGRDLRPKCHLPCSAEKLGELGDPGFQARLFWKRLWHFFLVADPPQGRQHVGKRWLFLLPVPRSEGKT